MKKRVERVPDPNCPECGGTGEVKVMVWAPGDRQVAEDEECSVCYPPNPVHLAIALTGLVVFWVVMGLIFWLVKS